MRDLERAVRNGSTLQWFDEASGQWLTPRDRETMLRILREDPTRQYRLRPVIAAGVRVDAPRRCDCAAHSAADCVCGAWGKPATNGVDVPGEGRR